MRWFSGPASQARVCRILVETIANDHALIGAQKCMREKNPRDRLDPASLDEGSLSMTSNLQHCGATPTFNLPV